MDINKIIREHRKKLKLTQKDMAKMLFISHNTYSQYETGKRGIGAETLFKIANILKMNLLSYQSEELQIVHNNFDHLDTLTKIPNRRVFHEKLVDYIKKGEAFALCLIDIDNFKIYNDLNRHDRGDEVLISLGKMLKEAHFQCGRLGGDEFGLLIPIKDKSISKNLSSLQQQFNENFFPLTLSIGIAYYPNDSKDPKKLYEKSDQALFQAKQNGKNIIKEY